MKPRITRRSFVKTTEIADDLAPFIPSIGANVGYPDVGTDLRIPWLVFCAKCSIDHRVELLWHPSARFRHSNQCTVF